MPRPQPPPSPCPQLRLGPDSIWDSTSRRPLPPQPVGNNAPARTEDFATTSIANESSHAEDQQLSMQPVSGDRSPRMPLQYFMGTFREAASSFQSQNMPDSQTISELSLDGLHERGESISKRKYNSATWTARVYLLPRLFHWWEEGINAYKRLLSQSLVKLVAVDGPSSEDFTSAITRAFGPFIQDRPWAPLQAKLYDDESLKGIPVLTPMVSSLAGSKYDFEFLRTHCATLNAGGKIDSLYVGLQHSDASWDYLTTSHMFLPDLEISSGYDHSLDTDESSEVEQKSGQVQNSSNELPPSIKRYFLNADERAKERARELRSPIVHELAVRDMTLEELQSRWHGDHNKLKPTLDKVADLDPKQQKYILKKMYWGELDVFRYEYATEEDREKAIDNAISMYDRMRVQSTEPRWQKLLPEEERGKGKCISRLQSTIRGPHQSPNNRESLRPNSYYGQPSKPPPSNARYWQYPNTTLGESFPPAPPSASPFPSPFQPPPPQFVQQPGAMQLAPDGHGHEIRPDAVWTRFERELVSTEVLSRTGYRYEARPVYVAVLGKLSSEEIIELIQKSASSRAIRGGWKTKAVHWHGKPYDVADSSEIDSRPRTSSIVTESQDLEPATAMAFSNSHQAGTQPQCAIPDTNMGDILCYLLPHSLAAWQEVNGLLLRNSPHVQAVPANLKQYLETSGGEEHSIALRRSNLRKTPAEGFVFGTNASTCDVLFISGELKNVQFRLYEDVNGVVTIEDQSLDRLNALAKGVVYVTHSSDQRGHTSTAQRPTIPLKNASTLFLLTTSGHSRWEFTVFLPVHEQTSDNSDVESLASVTDVPTLTSGTTFSSLGSHLDVSEATNEVAHLLLKDDVLGPLFRTSLQKTATDKAERNYTRLLIGFARDLRREANNPVEHHVGRLVKFRARFISQTLVSAMDPARRERAAQFETFIQQDEQREGRLEQFLESLAISSNMAETIKSAPPPIDSDGQVSDESAGEDELPRLSQIKDFIQLSTALAELRKRLKSFVSPEEAVLGAAKEDDTQEMSVEPVRERPSNLEGFLGAVIHALRVEQRTLTFLTNGFLRFIRPRVPEGHQRITWVCGCGKSMYSDVQELYDGGAADLEQDLRNSTDGAARSAATSSSNNPSERATQRQGSSSSNTSAMSGSTLGTSGAQSGDATTVAPGQVPPVTNRFVLLCVNGPRSRQLHQIPLASQEVAVASHDNDGLLFDNIRRAYIEVRRSYQPTFHPDTPAVVRVFVMWMHHAWRASQKLTTKIFKLLRIQWLVWWIGDDVFFIPRSADFVRFEVIPIKENYVPEILESACMPPEDEVLRKRNYHYEPCPPQVQNVLLRIPLLHQLFEPGLHTTDFWTKRIPKKLVQMLNYPSPNPVIGWGVHIIEGPNWYALGVLTMIFNVLSLAIASIYSVVRSDVSSGFAVGSFFLAVETMAVTLVLAMVTTSLLYSA